MILQNLHQHSTFCDGNDTPEEIVLEAIKKGFCGIGFSSHCYMTYADYCMTKESEIEYKKTINALKPKYAGRIDVFLGLEYDPAYQGKPEGYDYLIGSMHGLRFDGVDYEFDGDPVDYAGMINNHFGGDGLAYAKEYFRQLGAPVNLKELGLENPTDAELMALAMDATQNDTVKLSALSPMNAMDVFTIFRKSRG